MKDFFKFAGEHPFLTFFLFLIISSAIVNILSIVVKRNDKEEDKLNNSN
jgi:hypothetical protein